MTQIMAGIGLLGDSAADGGLDDPQAMRATMLQARLGRRISEILMLDADPLLPPGPGAQPAAGPGALTRPAALPADQDRRRPGHHPRRCRGRRDHPRAAGMGLRLA